MSLLYAATLFSSAALLFFVQPLVGRLVLPILGGSPGVWNTCMVFFQAVLLGGYAYAHAASSWLGVRRHAVVHLLLLMLPWLVLPIALPPDWSPPASAHPGPWLLALLAVVAGPPLFLVSASAPLLQKWFADTDDPAASDPYFLYSASNLGSMLALLAYPFVLEPMLGLEAQSRVWAIGYGLLAILVLACAVRLWRSGGTTARQAPEARSRKAGGRFTTVTASRRVRWVLLAFVPSSLMLSVTTYLTTDLAAIPLLWVVPLALYLLTFIFTFARRRLVPQAVLQRWLPLVVLVLTLVLLSEATEPVMLLMLLHLFGLLWIGLACHGALTEDRPATAHLTEFYFWLAVGGVAGGTFNALLAPLLFDVLIEYPLALVLACLVPLMTRKASPAATSASSPAAASASAPAAAGRFRAAFGLLRKHGTKRRPGRGARHLDVGDSRRRKARARALDLVLPLALGLLTVGLVLGLQGWGLEPGPLSIAGMFFVPIILCYVFSSRPLRFALGIAALFAAFGFYHGIQGETELRLRSFFGVHRVTTDPTGTFRQLVHGTTVHGQQRMDTEGAPAPLAYYYETGPIGQVFAAWQDDPRLARVGVVGLGAGSLTSYGRPGQEWTFFEIDPLVIWLARDSGYFTFLKHTPAEVRFVVGDARLTLAASERRFGLLVVDAFTSDAIPVHLLTREALQVYLQHLQEDGVLAFNISNRYLDLQPVLANLAAVADPPLAAVAQDDLLLSDRQRDAGKAPSRWVLMSRSRQALRTITATGKWSPLHGQPGARVWSDDYSNLVGALLFP